MWPIRLKIEGLTPVTGLAAVESALAAVPGVISVRMNPGSADEVHVETAETTHAETLVEAVRHAGFVAVVTG
jgi:copper chaperone CopZ